MEQSPPTTPPPSKCRKQGSTWNVSRKNVALSWERKYWNASAHFVSFRCFEMGRDEWCGGRAKTSKNFLLLFCASFSEWRDWKWSVSAPLRLPRGDLHHTTHSRVPLFWFLTFFVLVVCLEGSFKEKPIRLQTLRRIRTLLKVRRNPRPLMMEKLDPAEKRQIKKICAAFYEFRSV